MLKKLIFSLFLYLLTFVVSYFPFPTDVYVLVLKIETNFTFLKKCILYSAVAIKIKNKLLGLQLKPNFYMHLNVLFLYIIFHLSVMLDVHRFFFFLSRDMCN